MEDTLRVIKAGAKSVKNLSLNPCFNGRYSQSEGFFKPESYTKGLNPCSNGRYSQRSVSYSQLR